MSSEPLEPQEGKPLAGFEVDRLRDIKVTELALRFAFGASASILASVAGLVFSPVVGGMFLAFPAILPATLTLLEKKDDTEAAVHDVRGALLGSFGMIAFACVAAAAFTRWPAGIVLFGAAAAWLAVSMTLYLAVAAWRREHRAPVRGLQVTPPG
jgi:hypothetical protein